MARRRHRPLPASEQDVRDASVAGLHVSRRGLALTTAVTVVFGYLGLAATTHLWPWRTDDALDAARDVTVYDQISYPSPRGADTASLKVTVVDNASSPVRAGLLVIPTPATSDRSAIGPGEAIGLGDIQPCQELVYTVVFATTDPDPMIAGTATNWHFVYTVEGRDWSELVGSPGGPSPVPSGARYRGISAVYGVGGLSRKKGWLSETVDASPSGGPGCG